MEDEQFKNLQRSINEATEHAQGERDLETTRVEGNSPASGAAESYTAPNEPEKPPIRAHVELYGWKYLRFERWKMWYKHYPDPHVLWGFKLFRIRVLLGAV